jgi:DNA-binding NarL/FixJ family response regulator
MCGAFERLSPREVEVLALVAAGKPDKAIARELEPPLSEDTVAEYLRRIFRKLEAHSRVEATAIYVRHKGGAAEG